jgi:hypothetical protein
LDVEAIARAGLQRWRKRIIIIIIIIISVA